ncbi:substrate-binding domain-containing protein [Pantoea sp. DY-5]|uniref:substrate-binding domain-containing protein n=1 Tax=Pantoea sp. DY-5 TaxID=2871488 RepID=UPI001C963608|nr:substrate-binding domain-containing protein [Pantoea sp. DY-5]MBY4840327.1 substrate-binding domain-containing protein [Pantoea sp. DY-5]
MTTLKILAAGSLRAAWPDVVAAFTSLSGIAVNTDFGPAGMLRQRIEAGEPCDFFASANRLHPEALLQQRCATEVGLFAANSLCLTVKRDVVTHDDDWLALLCRNNLRLATSTPLSDPSGDYTWQLFENIEQRHPGLGSTLKAKARTLVGGPNSVTVPAGKLAAQWLIEQQHADMFIGYASYAPRLRGCPQLEVLDIPAPYNVQARYGWACCSEVAQPFAAFLSSVTAQTILRLHGFASVTDP